ncbi:MAG: hypothetical protein ABIT05_07275 [Chitinophagaceae bacterium]
MKDTNNLHLTTPWSEVKEKIKEANVELTDADLDFEPGQEEAMLTHLGRKMNRSRQEIKAWIESLSANKGKAS